MTRAPVPRSARRPGSLLGILLAAIVVAFPTAASAEMRATLTRSEAITASSSARAEAMSRELARAARAADVRAVLQLAATSETDPQLAAAAQERLLEQALLALGSLPPNPASAALVARQARRPPRIYVYLEDTGRRVAVPFYDAGAAARMVQRQWKIMESRDVVRRRVGVGAPGLFRELDPGDTSAWSGAALAVGESDAVRLRPYLHEIEHALATVSAAGPVAVEAALATGDEALMRQILIHADTRTALSLVRRIAIDAGSGDGRDLLAQAASRQDVASAALLRLGRLAHTDPVSRQLLLELLTDPDRGPSAATALARLHDPGIAAALREQASDETAPLAARRMALLGLCLDDSPRAREELERLLATTGSEPLAAAAEQCVQ